RFAASVWTKKGFPIYVCGDGIFTNKSGTWREVNIGVNYFTNDVRGNGLNDLFIIGDFGLIAHFNGLDWRVYADVFNAGYKSLSVNDDMIAAVGQRSGNAIVTIGRRN
ncbi:MAG: glucosyl transferase, partial [Bacteroidetes bacterium]|nr:glucosyl transferase [Bacteroidota bacterium]